LLVGIIAQLKLEFSRDACCAESKANANLLIEKFVKIHSEVDGKINNFTLEFHCKTLLEGIDCSGLPKEELRRIAMRGLDRYSFLL
jgi:hypothetical protein